MSNYVIPAKQAHAWQPIISTSGYKRRMSAKRPNQGVPIYPGIVSDSSDYLALMRDLAGELSDLRVSIDQSGLLGPEAVAGDFYQLLTVSGYGMNPISVPPVSNTAIREKLGLASGFITQRDRTIFREMVKLMFARSAPASTHIRRDASTGPPDFVNSMDKKKDELRHAYENIEQFLDLIWQDKFLELFLEFNAPMCGATGERWQPDKVEMKDGKAKSKDREVNDEAAARSGLRAGRRFAADKRVIKDGNEISGHFGGRRRTVYGYSFVPNYVCATFCAAWRKVYLEEYAFTWKHRTPEQILEKMRKYKNIKGFDVKQFDQTVATWMIDEMCSELGNYVDERVAKLVRLLFKSPYIVPYPWVTGTSEEAFNPLYGDDPFNIESFNMEVGLPSGIAINPDTGKLMMTWQYLVLLDRYFGDVLEVGLDNILRGEGDRYALLNMGDDCVLLFNDEGFATWFDEGNYKDPYFSLEEERPVSFLGNVPYRDDRGELKLAPNIISYLVNWLTPEHGIDHPKRRNFWAIGERERRIHYAQAPSYPVVHEAFERRFRDTFGVLPSSITAEAYQQQERLTNLSTWDLLVLQNPDYIHYKVEPGDLSDRVRDLIVTSMGPEETWPVVRKFTAKKFQLY